MDMMATDIQMPCGDPREAYFDPAFYARRYGIMKDGFAHYCRTGWTEGFQPNPYFSPNYYARHFDLPETQEPLAHLAEQGTLADYVSPAFDPAGYDRYYGRSLPAGTDRFAHFLQHGRTKGWLPGYSWSQLGERRDEAPDLEWEAMLGTYGTGLGTLDAAAIARYRTLIDPAFYEAMYAAEMGDLDAVEHYAAHGARRNYAPNPFFSAAWYKARNGLPDRTDALLDHVLSGRTPAPFFCARSYTAANSDSVADVEDAFAHFVSTGARQGRVLGLNGEQIAILRKLEPGFAWGLVERHYRLPDPPREDPASFGTQDVGEPLPAARDEPDAFHLDGLGRLVQGKSVVSFDIWDTLLRRSCDPDAIKVHAAAVFLMEMRRTQPLLELSVLEMFRLRQLAEFRVADAHYEYRYADMLAEWICLAGIHDEAEACAISRRVEEAEFARELAVTRVDPTALAMLDALQKQGVKLIAISDFYLPGRRLEMLFAHHGLDAYIGKVYASCDVLQTKREGRLFDFVAEQEDIDPTRWLHVGDNHHADFAIPKMRGIDAYLFTDEIEGQRKAQFQRDLAMALQAKGIPFLDEVEEPGLAADTPSKKLFQQLRRDLCEFAPLAGSSSIEQLAVVIGGFARFILEKGCAQGVDTIYFATREGNFVLEACARLVQADVLKRGTDYPRLQLLEVSRRATFAASLREASIAEIMRLWSLYSKQSMQALARTLNLDEEQMERFCTRYDIPFTAKITYPWNDPRVIELFGDREFCAWLKECIATQRAALWAYLEAIGFAPGANITRMMVDIGWRGSIQDNLAFIVNGQLDGAYMALYEYLAEQPGNAEKFGFLVNRNLPQSDDYDIGDFAALEFITNGPGGSVAGYRNGEAIRQRFADEEALLSARILPLQARILDEMDRLVARFGRLLDGTDIWRELARGAVHEYVARPDAEIAQVFLQLEHNETFGLGEIETIGGHAQVSLAQLHDSALHGTVHATLAKQRWPQTWLRQNEIQAELATLSQRQKLVLPRAPGISRAPALVRSLGYRVGIFAPEPIWGSGGHRTIYNLAKSLDRSGFRVDVFSERRGGQYGYKEQELAGYNIAMHDHWFNGITPSAGVATINYSSYYLSRAFSDEVSKFYFVQDFEAAFNPVSDGYVRGENSFAEGHSHLCVGRWLPHVLRTQFGSGAMGSGLGVDPDVYRTLPEAERKDRVVVLFQPEKWRRLPEHCLEALAIVKSRRPQTEIVFYGSEARPSSSFANTHLGLVNDLDALNELYNSARVGLCISLTNPSRIPYEMMAAGCVPVDVYRYNNLFDYEAGTGLLAYQSATSLAEAMLHLLDDRDAWQARHDACLRAAGHRTLAWETDGAVNALEFVLEGGDLKDLPVPVPSYIEAPFIARSDRRDPVEAWCAAQRRMAHDKG